MKKLKISILVFIVIFNIFTNLSIAVAGEKDPVEINKSEGVKTDTNTYNLLAPLPGLKSIETNDIGKYFNIVFNIAIGICGVLAVIMLVIHGISYMTSESFTEKAELKKKIWGPIGGLLLALGSYAILNTIDPALTGKEGLSVDQVSADLENIEGDIEAGTKGYQSYVSSGKPGNGVTGYDFKNAKFPSGIICPSKGMGTGDIPTIAKSFVGKITYAQLENPPKGPRGTQTTTGHFFLDCSSYVTTVLKCAGINPPGYAFTGTLFANAMPTTADKIKVENGEGYVNNIKLKPGDLVGWMSSDKVGKGGSGHVIMYIGGGKVIDAHGGKGRNPGLSVTGPFSLDHYKKQIRWLKPI